jgi:outer membrane usher protein
MQGRALVERNCNVRPDVVRIPLPTFEGSAALPSKVQVFPSTNSAYSAEVPAEPFSARDLTLTSGSGLAQAVVTEVAGRETVVDLPFFASDLLLRLELTDLALSVGRPRLGIGSRTDLYRRDILGVGTLRYGVANALALSGPSEGGAVVRLDQAAGRGSRSRSSHSDRGSGGFVDLPSYLSLGAVDLSGRLMRISGRFTDVAATTARPPARRVDGVDLPTRARRSARRCGWTRVSAAEQDCFYPIFAQWAPHAPRSALALSSPGVSGATAA